MKCYFTKTHVREIMSHIIVRYFAAACTSGEKGPRAAQSKCCRLGSGCL